MTLEREADSVELDVGLRTVVRQRGQAVEEQLYQVIIATANGDVYERELYARSAVMAVCQLAVDIDARSEITNVHARRLNQ